MKNPPSKRILLPEIPLQNCWVFDQVKAPYSNPREMVVFHKMFISAYRLNTTHSVDMVLQG